MRRIVPNPLKPNTSPLSPQEPCVLPRDQKATYNRRDFTSIAHCAHPSSSSVLFLSNTAAFQSLFTILSRDCRLRTDPTLCFALSHCISCEKCFGYRATRHRRPHARVFCTCGGEGSDWYRHTLNAYMYLSVHHPCRRPSIFHVVVFILFDPVQIISLDHSFSFLGAPFDSPRALQVINEHLSSYDEAAVQILALAPTPSSLPLA